MLRLYPARGRALRGCTLALLVGSLSTASAQPDKTLVLLQLETPPTMMGLGAQVVQRIDAAAREQGFTVVTPAEVEQRLGPEKSQQLRTCGSERACVLRIVQPLAFDRVVFGSLNRDEKSYLLKLWMIDGRSGETLADADRAILIASRRFQQDVAELVPRLLRGEREARGTLKLSASVPNVQVWIEGEPAGKTPLEVQLKPGKYQVRLEKKAYLPIKRFVDVFAHQVTAEEFRMILEPNAVPEEEKELPPLLTEQKASDESGIRVTTPAWVALGTAAALGGTGAYFGLSAQRTERELRDGFDADAGTYRGTRAQALHGQEQARIANLLFGAAGAAAVAGVLFTVFEVGGEEEAVSVTPAVSGDGASLSVGGTF